MLQKEKHKDKAVPYKYKKWKARDETRQQHVTKKVTKLDEQICKTEQTQEEQKIPDLFEDTLLASPDLSRYQHELTRGEQTDDLAEAFQYDELIRVNILYRYQPKINQYPSLSLVQNRSSDSLYQIRYWYQGCG